MKGLEADGSSFKHQGGVVLGLAGTKEQPGLRMVMGSFS